MIDTTYWGKDFGMVVLKDALSHKIYLVNFIKGKEPLKLKSSDFIKELENWQKKHKDFLNEKA